MVLKVQLVIQESKAIEIELLNNASNEFLLTADANGAVSRYHDNSKKFETTSSGVTVTGTLTATTFSGSGASLTAVDAANSGWC